MEVRRICPRCRKRFSQEDTVCPECEERLADASPDFEASVSMIREPVLLACNWDVETIYLVEALRQRNIPFYVEECQKTVPTGNIKEGTIDIIPFTNYYVDRSNLPWASEALEQALEETRRDEAAPVVFLDMPEEEPEDGEKGSDSGQHKDRALVGVIGGIALVTLMIILLWGNGH